MIVEEKGFQQAQGRGRRREPFAHVRFPEGVEVGVIRVRPEEFGAVVGFRVGGDQFVGEAGGVGGDAGDEVKQQLGEQEVGRFLGERSGDGGAAFFKRMGKAREELVRLQVAGVVDQGDGEVIGGGMPGVVAAREKGQGDGGREAPEPAEAGGYPLKGGPHSPGAARWYRACSQSGPPRCGKP